MITHLIEERMKGIRLTKTERLIADFMMCEASFVCFSSVTAVAQRLGISDASVIRFCRKIGFQGYPDLQKELQREMCDSAQPQLSPYQSAMYIRMQSIPCKTQPEQLCQRFMNLTLQNLNDTLMQNSPQKFDQAAALLVTSRRKHVVGFRGSAGAALHFGTFLSHILDSTSYSTKADSSVVEQMLDFGPEDCVVILSCERYSKMARLVADMARESGCRMIVITDKISSPVAYNADVVFVTGVKGDLGYHSFTPILFVVETLFCLVIERVGIQKISRLQRMEEYLSQVELY